MERLTNKKEADAQRAEYKRRLAQGYPRNIQEERFLSLAAYEDTGAEPEDVISAANMFKIACALHNLNAYMDIGTVEEFRALKEAEAQGRLVVVPCKVGDAIDTLFSHNEIIALWYDRPDDKHHSHLLWRGEAWKTPEEYREQRIIKFKGIISEKISESDTINLQVTPYIIPARQEAEAALLRGLPCSNE